MSPSSFISDGLFRLTASSCCLLFLPSCSPEEEADLLADAPWGMHAPIITLIDDDTISPESVQLFHDVCVANGIVGTYACIAERGLLYPEMFDMLHSYETEGFQVATHCFTQQNFYRWTENLTVNVQDVTSVAVGADYSYHATDGKTVIVNVEEVHLDAEGNGTLCLNYMQRYDAPPARHSGSLTRQSGSGDAVIHFDDYTIAPFRVPEKVRTDLCKAKDTFEAAGFSDMEYFVAPYGSQDEALQEMVRNLGFCCLVSIASHDALNNRCDHGRYDIPRFGFNATDSPGREFAALKKLIDQTATANGWLLVGTHVYNEWTPELFDTRFREFVDYAKGKGLRFVTLNEGFKLYEPVFEHYNK